MSRSPEIYPTDTVLVIAPRAYETEFRARVPRPLVALPMDQGRIVVAHDKGRVVIHRDEAVVDRLPRDLVDSIAKQIAHPVFYAFDFDDVDVLRKLLVKLVDDPLLLVEMQNGLHTGPEVVRGILFGTIGRRPRAKIAARYRSTPAIASLETVIRDWLGARGDRFEVGIALESLGDAAFDRLAALLASGTLPPVQQGAALSGLYRLTRARCIARRDELRTIAREIAAKADDMEMRSRAIVYVTTAGPVRGATRDARTFDVLRDVIEKDLKSGARERAVMFLDRYGPRKTGSLAQSVDASPLETEVSLDALERSIAALLRERDAAGEVIAERNRGRSDRLFLMRTVGGRNRTVHIAALDPDPDVAWDFGLFLSEEEPSTGRAGAEGRKFGSAEYALDVTAHWLLDWARWSDLPNLEIGFGPIDWHLAYQQYSQALRIGRDEQLRVLSRLASRLPKDRMTPYAGAIAALRDHERKWFVADLLRHANRVPRVLLKPLILAGLEGCDASSNSQFISLAAEAERDFTCDVVTTALVEGDDAAKLGAALAIYWLQLPRASDACRARCTDRIRRALADPNVPSKVRALLQR